MDFSIVIPAYEEARKIAKDVESAAAFLARNDFSGEVIVVDDGSRDDTAEVAENTEVSPDVKLQVIRYEKHRGKGYAVRKGMEHTSGEYAMFADSGSCVPYDDCLEGLDLLKYGTCDIAHGSRKMT
ncbi:MAG: glycosyltransferase, partial [Planctomycetota bacterium]